MKRVNYLVVFERVWSSLWVSKTLVAIPTFVRGQFAQAFVLPFVMTNGKEMDQALLGSSLFASYFKMLISGICL